jgi:hypothetical protein
MNDLINRTPDGLRLAPVTAQSAARHTILAMSLLSLFLWLQALAIFPALHQAVHSDAQHKDHHCAVTLLTGGQVDAAVPQLPAQVPPSFVEFAATPYGVVVTSRDLLLLPARGPPVSLS